MPVSNAGRLVPFLIALLCLPASAQVKKAPPLKSTPPPAAGGTMGIFPYQYVDYTQAGHEYRIVNAQAVVLGKILSMREIKNTEKSLNRSVTLRVENFLLQDKPYPQEPREIRFRCLPLKPPLKDMEVGDRCLVLLTRDNRHDNMFILPTDYHYYPVSADGVVTKYFKEKPTIEAPLLREVGLSDFLHEVKRVLARVSIEEQARHADLLIQGTVEGGGQGKGPEKDYYIARIAPDKIYKGDPGDGIVEIYSYNDMNKYVLRTQNRPSFRKGQKVFIFANKDPTLSARGPSNPDGRARWMLLSGRQSAWSVYPQTVWRSGRWPLQSDEFFHIIEKSIAP